jgi:pentatricopeptide repeat protein
MVAMVSIETIFASGVFADIMQTLVVLVAGYILFCPSCLGRYFVQRKRRDSADIQSQSLETPLHTEKLCKDEGHTMSGVASGTPKTCEDTLIQAYESTLADSSMLEFDEQTTPEVEISHKFEVDEIEVHPKLEVDDYLTLWRNSPAAQQDEELERDSSELGAISDCWSMWDDAHEANDIGTGGADVAVSIDANHSLETALASGSQKLASAALMTGARHCGSLWAHDAVAQLRSLGLELDTASGVELVQIFGSEHRADLAVDFWLEADDDFDEDELTAETDLYGAVLEVCVRCSDFDSATRTAESTAWRVPDCAPGRHAMLALVRWLARRQNFRQAWECYQAVRRAGGDPDLATHRAVLLASVRGNDMVQASAIFQDILSSGLQADGSCLSAMICGHCATGALDKAMTHFGMMKKLHITPTASLFDAIINGCMWGNAPVILEQVLVDMEADGVHPSNSTVAALVRHYGRGGDVDRALAVFQDMPDRYGLQLDSRAYGALISVCLANDRADLALDAAKKMSSAGFVPSARTYESLISSCLKSGDLDHAVRLFDEALCLSTESSSVRPARLEPRLLDDLLRLIGRRRQAVRLGAPFVERLVEAGVEVPEIAASILRSAESGCEVQYRPLRERQTERENWRNFSR